MVPGVLKRPGTVLYLAVAISSRSIRTACFYQRIFIFTGVDEQVLLYFCSGYERIQRRFWRVSKP